MSVWELRQYTIDTFHSRHQRRSVDTGISHCRVQRFVRPLFPRYVAISFCPTPYPVGKFKERKTGTLFNPTVFKKGAIFIFMDSYRIFSIFWMWNDFFVHLVYSTPILIRDQSNLTNKNSMFLADQYSPSARSHWCLYCPTPHHS
jgi:hypothetical protein